MVDTGDQSIVWVSDSFAEHFGLPPPDFTGRPVLSLLEGLPGTPWPQLLTGITSVDERFQDVRIRRVGGPTPNDEFELRGIRYVDAGRKVMISLRALAFTPREDPAVSEPRPALDPIDAKLQSWRDDAAFITDVRHAIAVGEISLAYQPIVDLDTGRLHHVEAVARWNHSQLGVLQRDLLVPLAERSGVIDELTEWVLDQACADMVPMGAEGIQLSLNLSVVQLRDPTVAQRIANILASRGFAAGRLWIEVTESAFVDDQGLLSLHALHDLGAHLVIDDFGTGYATFQHLTRLPVDALKIDTTFVSGVGVHSNDTAIVRSVVNLGLELGLDVVAEGVETEFQRAQLLALNCRLGQGLLFGRALSLTQLMARYGETGSRVLTRSSTALTKRELEIVRSLVSGDRVPAIAGRLFLSQSTVRNHLSSIYTKLGISSQQQLVDRFRGTIFRTPRPPHVVDDDDAR